MRGLYTRRKAGEGVGEGADAAHGRARGRFRPRSSWVETAFVTHMILGLRYPSRNHPGARNVVVFTDRLAALNGSVVLRDTSGTLQQSLP